MNIQHLTLDCRFIEAQKLFYSKVLGFELLEETLLKFSVQIGSSRLTFKKSLEAKPYHFAFNIPFNQIDEAKHWLEERARLIPYEEKEVVDFSAWNAEAMYFKDKDHNIVEFIGRRNLNQKATKSFDVHNISCVSEIGLPSKEISSIYQELAKCNLPIYDGNMDRFCAIGDEYGLFICIDNEKKTEWFPTDIYPEIISFTLDFDNDGVDYHLNCLEGKLDIKKQAKP
ncbi:hypothetical protein KMW28_15550 [Flammeovirga yaeyamensis]|uniref:VOC domain-containing protein n=1 Tax=Flammeovirga yaeyamensis TaxID=367791 RepID=A0AAX1N159_9BACT|nr:VOC family protein [Flammeovirga yaeyamensis]MBB3698572.1 catechol 2,3-dioxygenase-like lactoylglutathione lyase family enzyme [Flammeovirga yaeyamensis]NMF34079.1 VOC family protein [Flammeovirga yaeyamensis]QWG01067.1 hypothetical protein KMW28_15550 [Flammeovirga yaeyamensis]